MHVTVVRKQNVVSLMCRSGTAKDLKGTAFVVYEGAAVEFVAHFCFPPAGHCLTYVCILYGCVRRADIFDAKKALEHLSGFNVGNRYIVVLYYNKVRVCAADGVVRSVADLWCACRTKWRRRSRCKSARRKWTR